MLAHTRAAKKHAKILLFSELGKFYRDKVHFLGDFFNKNQFCKVEVAKIGHFSYLNLLYPGSYKSFQHLPRHVEIQMAEPLFFSLELGSKKHLFEH